MSETKEFKMSKINRIKDLLERITLPRLVQIKKEILEKEKELIYQAQNGDRLDTTHTEMVLNSIRDNRIPDHPKNLNRLMMQFITSALTYTVLREDLKRQFKQIFGKDGYPVLDDHKFLLSNIFHEPKFEDETNWHPEKLLEITEAIQGQNGYDLKSKQTKPRIIAILLTAPPVINAIFGNDLHKKYEEIEKIQDIPDAINRASELWLFAENVHKYDGMKIRNVGTALVCDFLKECGFKNYAKIDFQMIKSISDLIGEGCKKFNNFDLFVATQWIAQNIEMTPFRLDKILYVHGWMNGKNNRRR